MKNRGPAMIMKEIQTYADQMLEEERDRGLAPREECLETVERIIRGLNDSDLSVQVKVTLLLQTACAIFDVWMEQCQVRLN